MILLDVFYTKLRGVVMHIKVFMINQIRKPWDNLESKLRRKRCIIRSIDEGVIDSSEYDLVYDDEWGTQSNIDEIFIILGEYLYNKTNGTACAAATDVVRIDGAASIDDGYYFALSIGWQKINFDESRVQRNILATYWDVIS